MADSDDFNWDSNQDQDSDADMMDDMMDDDLDESADGMYSQAVPCLNLSLIYLFLRLWIRRARSRARNLKVTW